MNVLPDNLAPLNEEDREQRRNKKQKCRIDGVPHWENVLSIPKGRDGH